MAEAVKKEEVKSKGPLGKIMEAVIPGGLGDLGGGALGGLGESIIPDMDSPMAPPSSTPDAPATGPNLPLGF